jgi:mycofactocin system transcriptional regulator
MRSVDAAHPVDRDVFDKKFIFDKFGLGNLQLVVTEFFENIYDCGLIWHSGLSSRMVGCGHCIRFTHPVQKSHQVENRTVGTPVRGRPPATTKAEVGETALRLFERAGFEQTTLDDIASAVGISRRALFSYFASKNDMVWGDFDYVLERMRSELAKGEGQLMDVLRHAAVASNTYPPSSLSDLRLRLELITTVPALQAHSMLRYAEWRAVVAEFAAERLSLSPDDLVPVAIGHAALAASITAFSHWVWHREEDLLELLDRTYTMVATGFGDVSITVAPRACGGPI